MTPLNTGHTTFYYSFTVTMYLSYTVSEITTYCSKIANFLYPTYIQRLVQRELSEFMLYLYKTENYRFIFAADNGSIFIRI